ncbi:hypothetical protein H0H93_012862 [Arthromyces matolae]|nr:hypothetical protein H0H93_012862 [Arthromyces matolae]
MSKWLKQSGIVMLLPHGLDGAGPEHSSSRLERMLQLSNDPYEPNPDRTPSNVNIHVVFPTTPAQYFHLLRRQIKRNFRKPLIVAGPKALLRLSAASSSLNDFVEGTRFRPVLADPIADPSRVKRVVLCTGKIYYDLVKQREQYDLNDSVAFVRIEELSPFPFNELAETLSQYTRTQDIFWLQEEPRNQGAYMHVMARMGKVFEEIGWGSRELTYRGRKESALPAPGIGKVYGAQQKAVIDAAFLFLRRLECLHRTRTDLAHLLARIKGELNLGHNPGSQNVVHSSRDIPQVGDNHDRGL